MTREEIEKRLTAGYNDAPISLYYHDVVDACIAIHNEAIEAAIRQCDRLHLAEFPVSPEDHGYMAACRHIEKDIRALKIGEQAMTIDRPAKEPSFTPHGDATKQKRIRKRGEHE